MTNIADIREMKARIYRVWGQRRHRAEHSRVVMSEGNLPTVFATKVKAGPTGLSNW